MRQRAEVTKREHERIWVKVDNPAKACGNCKGCIRLTPDKEPEDLVFEFTDPQGEYVEGDSVIIETAGRDLIKSVAVLYGVPFVSLFIGYGITHFIIGVDAFAGLGAIGGLLAGAIVARPIARRIANQVQGPRILSRACS